MSDKKTEKKSETITKDMLIGDVIKTHPELAKVFFEFGLHCIGCHVSLYESLEDGAKGHGIDIDKFILALNKELKN